ncbi:ABC transporter ATP-binding protein [Microlunatus sp. GCM10028923]|uniref:ABC transporter ATP-binding protein n=1 Tax=Microlunatus sp. GCM10028923 TaxID=3273400 RepID=UPI00362046FD
MASLLRRLARHLLDAFDLGRSMFRASPLWSVVVALLLAASAMMPSVVVLASGRLVARLPALASAGMGSPAAHHALAALLAFVAAGFALAVLNGGYGIAVSRLGAAFRASALEQLARAGLVPDSVTELEDPAHSASLVAAAQHHREGVFDHAVGSAAGLLLTRLTGVTAGIVLVGFHWWAPLILLVALGVLHAQVRRWFEVVFEMATRQMGTERRQAEYLRGLLVSRTAAKEVRIFDWLPWMDERIGRVWSTAMAVVWRARSKSMRPLLSTGVAAVAYGLVLTVLAVDVMSDRLGVAEVTVFLQAILMMAMFGEFGLQGYDVARATTAVRHLDRLPADGPVIDRAPTTGVGPQGVVFDHVSFTYPGQGSPALRDVSFTVSPGQSVAIVGENGAGKSTLVRLLCGLATPTKGRVSIDTDGHRFDPADCRFAAVFQRFGRYELPLADNVRFGNPDSEADKHHIIEALGDAGGLPGRDDVGPATVLSAQYDGGTDLSGGQWQRIALARALFAVRTRAAGLLILDEPTAALDVSAEVELFARLLDVAGGATTVLVTHRLSAVRGVDRILVLKDGRLIEDGNHDDLLTLGGHYADLFLTQARRFRDDKMGKRS